MKEEIYQMWQRAAKRLETLCNELNPTDDPEIWYTMDDYDLERIERAEREVQYYKIEYLK